MSVICMVRHGQASFGKDNYDQLSEKGRKQCGILAEYLIRTEMPFDAVYAGDMIRQIDTAREIITTYRNHDRRLPELRLMTEFNEYNSRDIIMAHIQDMAQRDPNMKTDIHRIYDDKKAFQRVFEKIMALWVSGASDKPGIMTWRDFCGRVQSGIRKVMAENGRKRIILICTSGGPISAAVKMALGLSDEKALRIAWHLANTSVTTFVYNDDRIELTTFNSTAHLALLRDKEWMTYR